MQSYCVNACLDKGAQGIELFGYAALFAMKVFCQQSAKLKSL